jgi:hypothetical protein
VVNGVVDIGAVEGVFNPDFPLVNMTKLGSGNVRFAFTNLSGPDYIVLASTNVAAPLNTWSNLGAPLESPAGTLLFTGPASDELSKPLLSRAGAVNYFMVATTNELVS